MNARAIFILKCVTLAGLFFTAVVSPAVMIPVKLDYFFASGRYLAAIVYLAIFAIAFIGVVLTPFLRPWPIRTFLSIMLLLGFAVDQVVYRVSGSPLTMELAKSLWDNRNMAADVLPGFMNAISGSLWPMVIAALILCLPAKRPFSISGWLGVIPLAAMTIIITVAHVTHGNTVEFPSAYSVPAKFSEVALLGRYDGPRDKITYQGLIRPVIRHIVMIVDESVRGDYLGVNNNRLRNTPYLEQNRERIANFKTAVSAWNCSEQSRMVMRIGLRPGQLPDRNEASLHQPSIWQYAHKAGYRTVFLDAWINRGELHSYMNAREFAQIDHPVLYRQTRSYRRDPLIAEELIKQLKSAKPSFILINKFGTHFPYFKDYPPEHAPFSTGPTATPGMGAPIDHIMNSYHNAIQWSVDGFFKTVMESGALKDAILIYTSDHGQSFFKRGQELLHCNQGDVLKGEGFVPLLAISGRPDLLKLFRASASRSANKMTHFQIFPTLLRLMGYDKSWIRQRYGSDLLDPPPAKRRFMTGGMFSELRGNLRYSRSNKWIDVD